MKSTLIQLGCILILSLRCAMTSFYSVWPSYAIDVLKSDQSPLGFKITTFEGNLTSCIPMIGALISTMLASYVSETFGRKKSQIFCGLLNTVAWLMLVTARSTIQLIFARFLLGLSSGLALVTVFVYISEITKLTIRGSAATMTTLLYNLGIMTSYLMGWFCSYNLICYISLTATVIYVLLVSCLKETPAYLLKTGKEKEALNSLKFYRGESETTEAILEELSYLKSQGKLWVRDGTDVEKPMVHPEEEKLENKANLDENTEKPMVHPEEEKLENKANVDENTENTNPWILLFTVPHYRRALINSVMFVVLTMSMGMVSVQTYAGQFFASAAPALSRDLCSVILSLIMVLNSGLTMIVTDLVPRRTLMISTCIAATTCLATLGTMMRWSWAPSWLVLVVILVYVLVIQLGVCNLVFVQLSETYGPQVCSTATAIVLSFMSLANFTVLFLFVPAVEYIGMDGAFFVFAAIGAITTVVSYFFMKETRHVPLEEVQKMYASGFLYKRVCNNES